MTDLAKIVGTFEHVEGVRLMLNEPMSGHTSLGVGGPADCLVRVASEKALMTVLAIVERHCIPLMILGAGTNMLVTDEGIEGVVLALDGDFRGLQIEDAKDSAMVTVGAALPLAGMLAKMAESDVGGAECLTGIPGTVGGAVRMNAGTSYGSMDRLLLRARLVSGKDAFWLDRTAFNFGYRQADVPDGCVIVAASLNCHQGRTVVDADIADRITRHRREKQPAMRGTAGSFFANPDAPNGLFAGKMIEAAGLKGLRNGGAEVSPLHANFLWNSSDATAQDLLDLAIRVQAEVRRQTGVSLRPEVCIVGRGARDWRARLSVG